MHLTKVKEPEGVNSDSSYFPGNYNYIAKESKLQYTISAPLIHQSDELR